MLFEDAGLCTWLHMNACILFIEWGVWWVLCSAEARVIIREHFCSPPTPIFTPLMTSLKLCFLVTRVIIRKHSSPPPPPPTPWLFFFFFCNLCKFFFCCGREHSPSPLLFCHHKCRMMFCCDKNDQRAFTFLPPPHPTPSTRPPTPPPNTLTPVCN